MVKASQGPRHRTRKVLRKRIRERGSVPPLSLIMHKYDVGDKVYVKPNPAIHNTLPHRRYVGKVGAVIGMRGRAYIVRIRLGRKEKKLIIYPEHLRPAPQ